MAKGAGSSRECGDAVVNLGCYGVGVGGEGGREGGERIGDGIPYE